MTEKRREEADLIDLLTEVDTKPAGWLSVKEYATRAGASYMAIYTAVRDGRLPRRSVAAFRCGANKARRIIIDWDATAYQFFYDMRSRYRPADFVPNENREYKPIRKKGSDPASQINEIKVREAVTGQDFSSEFDRVREAVFTPKDLLTDQMHLERVTDLTTARYRSEQLKIEKQQIELRKARNEVIETAQVVALNHQIAMEVKAEWGKLIPRLAPVLAAENDPREVKKILTDAWAQAFSPLYSSNLPVPVVDDAS